MNQQIYCWHPSFKRFLLDDGLVLYAEQQQLLLPARLFPLMDKIDGETRSQAILQQAAKASVQSTFLYYCQQFCQQGLLLATKPATSQYREPYGKQAITAQYGNLNICNLSNGSKGYLDHWLSLLSNLTRLTDSPCAIHLVLVDDYFDPRLTAILDTSEPIMVLKISGETLWLSPVFTAQSALFSRLQRQLFDNHPTRKMLSQRFDGQNLGCLFCEDLPRLQQHEPLLSRLICQQVSQQTHQNNPLITLQLSQGHTTNHNINRYFEPTKRQARAQPIGLKTSKITCNDDGGARQQTPQQTLARLLPLVDQLTGPIAYLQTLETSTQHPVTIFKSGFFKVPGYGAATDELVQTCMGKGVTTAQSQASALGEALERLSAQYTGDEIYHQAKRSALSGYSYGYQQLAPYSELQYQRFTDQSHPDSKRKQAAIPYQDQAIAWCQCWSLSYQHPVWMPLTSCYANTPFTQEQYGRWQSNGCAAGNTLEEAILQGLYEVIERDAVAIWWYNRITRPTFDCAAINPDYLAALSATISPEQDFWLLDLTTDIGVPVMAAIGKQRQNSKFSFGFGCHLQPELAAQRALTELCQLTPIREQNAAPFDFNAIVEADYLYPDSQATAIAPFCQTTMDLKLDILNIVEKLSSVDFETVVLDHSRPHLPIYTAKVWVPGLCHIWPQLANARLYQTPVDLGWLAEKNTQTNINPQALYI